MDQDIIRRNNFGQLSYCKDCGTFHLTFSNILIELSDRELRAFHMVVKEIDIDFWKNIPNNQTVRRNFPINTSQQNLVLIFDFSDGFYFNFNFYFRSTHTTHTTAQD